MRELKANTEVIVTVGPFVDVGDGFTPQTDIALSGNEAEVIKHGSTSVTDISSNTWAAVTNCRGHYSLTLSTSDTEVPGNLRVVVQDDSDCLPVTQDFVVLTEHAWDMKYGTEGEGGGIQMLKLWYGTFTSADATTITMANETAATAIYVGARVMVALESGTNCAGRNYFGTVGASRVITVDPAFSADSGDTPSGTIVGAVYAAPKSPTTSVATTQLADGHLTAAKFGADCITAAKIADDAIVAANLATGALTADAFAADAIVAATLATGALTADAFAADAIVAATLATGALTADAFAANAIVAATLNADCITNAKIADNALAAENIATDAITSVKIADDALAAAKFATGALTADAFAADALVAATFATDSITDDALAADAIDAIFDEVFAGSTTFRQLCRGIAAVLLGKATGLNSNAPIYRDIADSMPVVSATTDGDGNRSAVTLDLDDTP